jgi:colicin import membrane protein
MGKLHKMENEKIRRHSEKLMEMKWSSMMVLSVGFHIAVFSMILFIPESFPARRSFDGAVYEVNLVEMPGRRSSASESKGVPAAQKAETILKKESRAKRIPEVPKPREKPVIIAKKTLEKVPAPVEKPKVPPSELIDEAVSKIEKEVKSEQHLDNALARLESKASETKSAPGPQADEGSGGEGSPGSTIMQIYQADVESLIKSNWHYPVAMDNQKDVEAIVVLMVKRDGTIVKSSFEKRSGDDLFDESVLNAIERSDPLPPFPESFTRSNEEFEIKFNLKDLETR